MTSDSYEYLSVVFLDVPSSFDTSSEVPSSFGFLKAATVSPMGMIPLGVWEEGLTGPLGGMRVKAL